MVAKRDCVRTAHDCHPITVMSCVYRGWAALRAASLQPWLTQVMPRSMFGFLAGRDVEEYLYEMGVAIEAAQQYPDCEIAGIALDVTKAFNYIPRAAALRILCSMGLPPAFAHMWRQNLARITRRVRLGGTFSKACVSSSGFPEGCPLSPIAMLAVAAVWHKVT